MYFLSHPAWFLCQAISHNDTFSGRVRSPDGRMAHGLAHEVMTATGFGRRVGSYRDPWGKRCSWLDQMHVVRTLINHNQLAVLVYPFGPQRRRAFVATER